MHFLLRHIHSTKPFQIAVVTQDDKPIPANFKKMINMTIVYNLPMNTSETTTTVAPPSGPPGPNGASVMIAPRPWFPGPQMITKEETQIVTLDADGTKSFTLKPPVEANSLRVEVR